MKTFKLHLIRHGQTQGNADGIFVGGGLDLPLSPKGRAELEALAAHYSYPGIGVLFSSPLQRALQTADILYPLMQNRVVVEEMRECHFGHFEGQKLGALADDEGFTEWLDPESDYTPEGGENGRDFAARLDKGFYAMFQHMMDHNISEGACVTHGGVIMSLMGRWALPKRPPLEWSPINGCGFAVRTSASLLMRDRVVEEAGRVPAGIADVRQHYED